MASLFKRRKHYWASFYVNGQHLRKALKTTSERVAKAKLKRLEYELETGELQAVSKLHLATVLQAFCRHLMATRTYKSYKNDFSRLRVFFGPICQELEIHPPGSPDRRQAPPIADKYEGQHVQAKFIEDVTSQVINRFLSDREARNNWSAKTANLMRQTLHKLFNYAIKHHGFCNRDQQHPNPAAGVDRRRESAPQIRFLTLEQIDEQLAALRVHPTIHAMVATYIYAGLRREHGIRAGRKRGGDL